MKPPEREREDNTLLHKDKDLSTRERERERERERDSDSDGLLLPGFKPIERGGWGEGIVTNTKRSTHVHILNIMDTAMLF